MKGEGNQQDYGMRVYDPRLGKFLSVDPLAKQYPWYTPYQFAGNKPIWAIDLDGGEENIEVNNASEFRAVKLGRETAFNIKKGVSNAMLATYQVFADIKEGQKIRAVVVRDENDLPYKLDYVDVSERSVKEKVLSTIDDILGVGTVYTGRSIVPSGPLLMAKAPNATTFGQITKMLASPKLTGIAVSLFDAVKNFKNKTFNIGGEASLMLDKAGLTHILGRHHPNFRIGEDKALQSLFDASTTIDDVVNTIGGIVRENQDKIKQLMSGKGATSADFLYKGKTYRLGIDPSSKSRIGQFFEISGAAKQ